jgi:redox-sensitive bicupin YhaK (pirin superfamily)
VEAGPEGVNFLVLAARPLREPVVQCGPFAMNMREEIEQALADCLAQGRRNDVRPEFHL